MRLFALFAALAPAMVSSTTANWEMNAYQEFLKGRFSGISLSRDGRLSLAPKLENIYSPDQPQIWSMAKAPDGSIYFGTGHRGRVYRVDPKGHGSLIWTAEQPEVFALAVDSKGVLYAGTSPDGKVYRIENGKASAVFSPVSTKYIWSIAIAPDGVLYVGTGDQGKLYAVKPDGQSSVYYESGQSHITALAIDSQGRLLAGSEPNGILYRLTGPGKAFVLYDANLPEIRTILPASDGSVYAAALGGSVAKRTGTVYGNTAQPGGVTVTAPTTSITVTDTNAQSAPEVKPPKTEAPKQVIPQQQSAQPVVQAVINPFDVAGVEKSAVYRIRPDNTVETVWSSKEENVYDLAAADGRLIFSTDLQGRIYRLGTDRKATLIAQTSEGETTRLLDTPMGLLAATGDMGKLFRLGQNTASTGSYESPVHDSGTVARWGHLSWRAEMPAGSKIFFHTRSGNSARPDNTWSDWSPALSDSASALITSPNARYIQWKAEFMGTATATPTLDSVTAAYLPQNTPPSVRSVSVAATPSQQKNQVSSAAASNTSAFSITVTDIGEAAQATSAGNPTQTLSRGGSQQTQITWQADDPDGDRLSYAIYFRGEEEQEWKLLRANYYETTLTLDPDVLADGRYFFRVVASDRPSNAGSSAKESELISAPVLIDNTPPVVTASQRRNGAAIEIDVDAADQTSALRRCEYSIDAGPWFPAEASDGVTDSPRERFSFRIEKVTAGEHLVAIRVYDAAGNAGLAKVVIR
jgi:sugar lactone lactonase YvrE